MAVKKKGLRQVKVNRKLYFWRVSDSTPPPPEGGFVAPPRSERLLHIISADKQFIVHYRLPEAGDAHSELRVEGPLFPRAPGQKEVEVPRWRHDMKRFPTADFVRRLIGWCLEENGD